MTAVPPGWTPEQAQERLDAATPGPWKLEDDWDEFGPDGEGTHGWVSPHGAYSPNRADNELIAHAPTDIAALLALLGEAREALIECSANASDAAFVHETTLNVLARLPAPEEPA